MTPLQIDLTSAPNDTRTVSLHGCDSQLFGLDELFLEVTGGRCRIAVVSGPAGTGKTELLTTFGDQMVAAGAPRLVATASQAEQAVPYGVLAQLFRKAGLSPERNGELARLLRRAGAVGPTDAVGDGESSRIFHELCLALLDVVERIAGPVVICVDDAHYADTQSLQCLSSVMRRLRNEPLLVICTESVHAESTDILVRAEFPPEPLSLRLTLGRLGRSGLKGFLTQWLGLRAANRLAAECYAATGGNPLLVHGIVEDNRASASDPDGPLVIGSGFDRAVLRCLFRCGPAAIALCRQLALLEEPLTAELLSQFVGLDPKTVTRAFEVLESAGLLTAGWFRHPRIRSVVLGSMAAEERADGHTRTAHLLYQVGASTLAVAGQLLAAGQVASGCSVSVLHEAAEQALGDGEVDLAMGLLRLAYQFNGDERQKATTVAMLARTEWRADPYTARRRTPDLTAATQAGQIPGKYASVSVNSLLWFGNTDAANTILHNFEELTFDRDPEAAAQLQASRMCLSTFYPGLAEPFPSVGGPDVQVPAATTPQGNAAHLFGCLLTNGPTECLLAEAEQILHSHQLDERSMAALLGAVTTLVFGDQLVAAERFLAALDRQARALSAPVWCGLLGTARAEIALRRGDLRAADREARSALAAIPGRSWGVAVAVPLSTLLQVSTAMGAYDQALEHLRVPVPDAAFRTPAGLYYLSSRGRYHLAIGLPQAALRDFLAVGELAMAWRQDSPAVIPWRGGVARALLQGGQAERAREFAREQLDLCRPDQTRARVVSLRVLAACSRLSARPKLLGRALEALQDIEARIELARVLHDLGAAHQELGQYSKGRLLIRQALKIAEEAGAVLPGPGSATGSGNAERAALAMVNGPAGTLSDAELRVAKFAASGHSNRQIANRLFVTVSTVEQHLTRVYRKLQVTRRTDIARALHSGMGGAA
ncbi:ATP-binding protein [Kitasatospora sp. NPDC057015]|uniref:ATP-binding protein n=1 Tax=Kitasatospora sp. NPDC057015 TaxID=3346001 RepID=UPI00363F3580